MASVEAKVLRKYIKSITSFHSPAHEGRSLDAIQIVQAY